MFHVGTSTPSHTRGNPSSRGNDRQRSNYRRNNHSFHSFIRTRSDGSSTHSSGRGATTHPLIHQDAERRLIHSFIRTRSDGSSTHSSGRGATARF
ncbi:hypothetical protein NHX12_007711 [Muraenolepis orangiensis]|uniref:Uncharacterized protein n=1 Tax=Muraenolepis orangiensis TaxID=630683 RepID=A0A9Q0IBG2_9TELE|nr:hypothetical protein NHX12_007711 [Muraenolepis orangiensis]